MGFGIKLDVKVEAPKVELPKVDVAAAVGGAVAGATAAVTGAVGAVTGAVTDAVGAVTGAVSGVVESLSSVAGAIADAAVSFTGAIEDGILEPHLQLDANASYGDTKFEKGPVWIRIEMPSNEVDHIGDILHLFTSTGSFDQKKEFRDYDESTPETVDVLFEDAPMDEKYSLEIIPEEGDPHLIFSDIPYGDLRKTKQRYC